MCPKHGNFSGTWHTWSLCCQTQSVGLSFANIDPESIPPNTKQIRQTHRWVGGQPVACVPTSIPPRQSATTSACGGCLNLHSDTWPTLSPQISVHGHVEFIREPVNLEVMVMMVMMMMMMVEEETGASTNNRKVKLPPIEHFKIQ